MCLLLLHHRVREDAPLVLLANRDEYYDRPFEGPAVRDEALGIVAPRDLRAGGTWLGLNRRGLVAAVTNRRGEDVLEGARSRGLLVGDVLRQPSARAARDWAVAHVRATPYAGFHLLLADGRDAFVVRHRLGREGADALPLPAGSHVLTNLHEPDELGVPRGGEAVPGELLDALLARLERLATDTTPDLPGGHRVFKQEATRGTVCSAIVVPPDTFRFVRFR